MNMSLEELRAKVNAYRVKFGGISYQQYEAMSMKERTPIDFFEVAEWRELELMLTSFERRLY
jgi:hypothetical protein